MKGNILNYSFKGNARKGEDLMMRKKKIRYLYRYSFNHEISKTCIKPKVVFKSIKYLCKLRVYPVKDEFLYIQSICKSIKQLDYKDCKDNYKYESRRIYSVMTFLKKSSNLKSIYLYSYNLGTLSRRLLTQLSRLKKLEDLRLQEEDEQDVFGRAEWKSFYLSKLLKFRKYRPINLMLDIFMSENLSLSPELLSEIKTIDLGYFSSKIPDQKEVLQKLNSVRISDEGFYIIGLQTKIENMVNLKDLNLLFRDVSLSQNLILDLSQLKNLKKLSLIGTPENINFESVSNDLTVLNVSFQNSSKNLSLSFKPLESFVKKLKDFTKLEELTCQITDLTYVNEIIQNLPHNLSSLKKVDLNFGTWSYNQPIDHEKNLRLKIFLDWMISLPNLEEISLRHPYIFYCNCSYFEGNKALAKLREISIKEQSLKYNCQFLEGEYTYEDFQTILSIFNSEKLESLSLTLHLELWDQKAINWLCQKLMDCKKLRYFYIDIILKDPTDTIIKKLESVLKSFSDIHKFIQVHYLEESSGEFKNLYLR